MLSMAKSVPARSCLATDFTITLHSWLMKSSGFTIFAKA